MSIYRIKRVLPVGVVTAVITLLACGTASAASNKLSFTASFGREVNLTQTNAKAGAPLEDHCVVKSGDICHPGSESSIAGGFTLPLSVALDPGSGSVYVVDNNNPRVQEFTTAGEFVLTFGWNVNKTKVENGASQAERNVCTAASKDTCQSGEAGTGLSEQLAGPQDVAVDPTTHDVYVAELFHKRIDEYTPEGKFVLMIGGEVNKTKVEEGAPEAERNLCTAVSKDVCQEGQFAPHALKNYLESERGNLLAVGPQGVLYVGDEERVQEFEPGGKYKGELSLASLGATGKVTALAVDEAGNVYLSYSVNGEVIHRYDSNGNEVSRFAAKSNVVGLARDAFGRLAVIESESTRGVLYGASGEELGTFGPPGGMNFAAGLAFKGAGEELYVADKGNQAVEIYALVPVVEVRTGAALCTPGLEHETSVTLDCALTAEVNPNEVNKTEVWFGYGTTKGLGSSTERKQIPTGNAFVSATATAVGLRPGETYYYLALAEDENTGGEAVPGECLASHLHEPCAFTAPSVAPKITCGTPEAFDVTFSSAVLLCALNPENAKAVYRFQYGPCPELNKCAGALETAPLESSAYGAISATQTASGLAPSTTYHYRLVANNEHNVHRGSELVTEGGEATGAEGAFTTGPAPTPTATTGPVGNVTAVSATLTGTVDPHGAGATYSFQVGTYNGAGTVYGTIASGPTGAETGPVSEGFTLTGLQPGTTYAYRVMISSAYGVSEGAPVTFTTAGLPTVLFAPPALEQLLVPNIAFPKELAEVTLTRAQRLARALKACAKKPKRKRAACRRSARRKYAASKKARKS